MKKFFMIAACFLFLFKGEVAHAQEGKIKLQDVTNGVYWPKQIDGVNPAARATRGCLPTTRESCVIRLKPVRR